MKTLEKLLQEYKIRFKETEEIELSTYPFDTAYFSETKRFDVAIQSNGANNFWMRNPYGIVCRNGVWATAKITDKPAKWVVERDESHPMWNRFIHYCNNNDAAFTDEDIFMYHSATNSYDDLLMFTDHQYLTLDQWTELFLDRPKGGDWCLFWDVSTEMPVVDVLAYNTDKGFRTADGSLWKNCQKLSPELVDMLEKEISQI